METEHFSVPMLAGENQALDLANALNSLSGVMHVDVDASNRTVTVQYDPSHASRDLFQGCITGSGYMPNGNA